MQLRKLGSKFPVPLILVNYDGVYDGEPTLDNPPPRGYPCMPGVGFP